tara:strand:- start:2498 stop:2839 length:342 start_codon:yes stop_codon:yes gene_type:complete
MKHLKLVINNGSKKKDVFFNRSELQTILNLYASMVSGGEWKDYGLSISKREVSFNVYHRASDYPAYKITKNLKPKNKNEKYLIKDSRNVIIKNSENLKSLIENIIWKKFKLVN